MSFIFRILANMKNKFDKKSYMKAWREANKDKVRKQKKSWNEANRDKVLSYKKNWGKSCKHKPIVYLLVNENYVGTTESIKRRLNKHKNSHNRDISDVIELAQFDSRDEAIFFEAALQLSYGFNGFNSNQFNL